MSDESPAEKSLRAQCPQCQSRFRLTTQHLEAAKGWVQCGVCGHVFFSGLTSPAKPAEPQPSAPTAPPAEATPAINIQPVDISISAQIAEEIQRAESEHVSPILSGLSNRMAEDESPSTMTFGPKLESIILVDPKASYEDHDPGPLPVIEPRAEPGRAAGLGSSVPTPYIKPASATGSDWIPRQPSAPASQKIDEKGALTWLWWLLSIVLVLALFAQPAWFMRDSLAARYPALRPALEQICGALDCTLGLPRDSSQIVVLDSDLKTEDDGRLVLTLYLANKAATNMAWPVLELTLTDVEDQPLARRLFAPSEYLNSPKLEAEGIAKLSEVPPIALTMQSKDVKAAGYRLRMFY